MLSHLQRTQSGTLKGKELDTNTADAQAFASILEACGAVMGESISLGKCPGQDSSCIPRRLERRLRQTGHVPAVVKSWTEGFIAFAAPSSSSAAEDARSAFAFSASSVSPSQRFANLTSLLTRMSIPEDAHESKTPEFRIASNYSVAKVFLSIPALQSAMISILMDMIPEVMNLPIPEDASLNENLPLLILHQLRFLDSISDSKLLTLKLVHLLKSTQPVLHVHKEVVGCIPEIMPDSGLEDVVNALQESMTRNVDVTVCVLDTLGTIGVPPHKLPEITDSVLELMDQAQVDSLPVIIRFLLQTAPADKINELIPRMRDAMDFDAIAASLNRPSAAGSDATLIFDALKSGILRQKYLLDAWLKNIDRMTKQIDYKPIDIIVLLLLRSDGQVQKRVDLLIKTKIKKGLLSLDVLQTTIDSFFGGLQQYFSSILSLCESLVREDSEYRDVASVLYRSCFRVFDIHYRQQLVGCLIAHIGSGITHEVDCGLHILLELTKDNPEAVLKFSIFVKSLLDYLDQLSILQIRVLYEIFAMLALSRPIGGEEDTSEDQITFESALLSDMRITIRKQLGSDDPKFKQMGVLGAVALIKRLAEDDAPDSVSAFSGGSVATNAGGSSRQGGVNYSRSQHAERASVSSNAAIKLIGQIFTNCERGNIQCLSLLLDELSYLITHCKLKPCFLTWVNESFASIFIDNFVIAETDAHFEKADVITIENQIWYALHDPKTNDAKSSDEVVPETVMSEVVEATIMDYDTGPAEEDSPDPASCIQIFPPTAWAYSGKLERALKPQDSLEDSDDLDATDAVEPPSKIYNEKQLVMLLPASFKFLQAVEMATNDSLNDIGQLLNVGLIMFDRAVFEDTLSGQAVDICCSSLFYAINCLIEVLNAFSKKSILENREELDGSAIKCLLRIKNVIELTKGLEKLLGLAPRWAPVGFFRDGELCDDEAWAEQSDNENADGVSQPPTATASKKGTQKSRKGKGKAKIAPRFSKLSDLKPIMREIEIDVFNLLTCSDLSLPTPDALDRLETDQPSENVIQFPELLFLLNELKYKLEFMAGTSQKEKVALSRVGLLGSGSVAFSNLQRVHTTTLMDRLVGMVPALCTALESAHNFLRKAHEQFENDEDFIPKDKHYVQAVTDTFDSVLQCFTLLLQWPEMKKSKRHQLIILKSIASRTNPELELIPSQGARTALSKCAVDSHDYFYAFKDFVPSLPSSVLLLKLLLEFQQFCLPESEAWEHLRLQVSEFAKNQMASQWDDRRSKAECIPTLLQAQIKNSVDSFEVVHEYVTRALRAFNNKDENILSKYPLLDKTTFPAFFKIVFIEMVSIVENASSTIEIEEVVRIGAVFSTAVEFSKIWNHDHKLIVTLMKYSKNFLQSYVKRIIPFLDKALQDSQEKVIAALKNVQTGTRILQTLSNEFKAGRESLILPHIPPLRKAMEAFIFQVKRLMVDNERGNAFIMANLKHKNLRGEQISSQIADSDEENDDEEVVDTENEELVEPEAKVRPQNTKSKPSKKERKEESATEEQTRGGESSSEDEGEDELAADGNGGYSIAQEAMDDDDRDDEEENESESEEEEVKPLVRNLAQKRKQEAEPEPNDSEEEEEEENSPAPPVKQPKIQEHPSFEEVHQVARPGPSQILGGGGLSKHLTGGRRVGLTKKVSGGLTLTQQGFRDGSKTSFQSAETVEEEDE
ncbi:Fanconi anemia group D2 protein [Chytriomyces hyalinus]|nr:Fanconi anemia group D2 protein [Chytriomyces hyalinus]